AFVWVALGGPSLMPLVLAAVAFLLITTALIWRDDLRRGRAASLAETPTFVIVGDLAAAGVWMVASAPNERSVAFILVIAIGALAMFRLGRVGVIATGVVYIVSRVTQELVRTSLGIPTPPAQLFAETIVVGLVLVILSATVGHYRVEQVLEWRASGIWADYQEEPSGRPAVKALGLRSTMGVPIILQGEIVATLTVARLAVRPFEAEDVRALEGLAGHAAIALRNARL